MKLTDYIYRAFSYISFRLTSVNTLGYGIHSPYLFHIVRDLFYDENAYYCFADIEKQRQKLLTCHKPIYVQDLGTGKSENRLISHIAKTSLASPKEAQLLFRLVNFIHPNTILELGTSLGITTSYLAAAAPTANIITIEGSENIASQARQTLKNTLVSNVQLLQGNIDQLLPQALTDLKKIDFAFIDANHTYQATINYFSSISPLCGKHSVVVLDDIHYSKSMHKAWQEIQSMKSVTSTIDLWHMGIVFFNPQFPKKHYKTRI